MFFSILNCILCFFSILNCVKFNLCLKKKNTHTKGDSNDSEDSEELGLKLDQLMALKSEGDYEQIYSSALDAAIQAVQQGIKIQRKKLFIKGVRMLANPSAEVVNKHFTEWINANPEFKFEIENGCLLVCHPTQGYVSLIKHYVTHPAFKTIHKMHRYSDWLETKFWQMYSKAQKYYKMNKDLKQKNEKPQVEDPDTDDNDSVHERWESIEALENAIADILSDYRS